MRDDPSAAWLRLGRVVLWAVHPAHRRAEVEGDLIELWHRRRGAGRRDLRRAFVRDLVGIVVAARRGRGLARVQPPTNAGVNLGGFAMRQDVQYALRLMRRRPGTTVATVLTLAIGIGAGSAIFTAVDRLLLRPLPFPDAGRIVHVEHAPITFNRNGGLLAASFLAQPAIAAAGVWAPGGINLDSDAGSARLRAAIVDDGFFSVMNVPPLLGQPLPASDGTSRLAVLSHDLWRTRFNADRAVIGLVIQLNSQSYTVTGVMPPGFTFPGRTDVWVPPMIDLQITGAAYAPEVVARISPHLSLEEARAALSAYDAARRPADATPGDALALSPLGHELTRQSRPTLLFLSASVALLILVVCASVSNLMLARVSARVQEFAVRRALGASRWRVARQTLVEGLMLSLAGAALGAAFAGWALRGLVALAPATLDGFGSAALDVRVLAVAVGVAVACAALFATAPGLAAASQEAEQVVRAGREEVRSPAWRYVRQSLVVGQMAIALVLLAASIASVSALLAATRIDLGFGSARTVSMTMTLPLARFKDAAAIPAFYERAHERLTAVPGIRRIGATGFLPGSADTGVGLEVRVPGRTVPDTAPKFYASRLHASPDYFAAMGIRLISGRPFLPSDRGGAPPVAILGETTARELFPNESPIGRQVGIGGTPPQPRLHEVIGVVADVRLRSLSTTSRLSRQVYVSLLQSPPFGNLSFAVEADGEPLAIVDSLRAAMLEVDATIPPYDIQLIDTVIDRYLASHRLAGSLISGFSLVTLIVAAIGLYGVMAQRVTERTREIGIRLALGASPRRLRLTLIRQGILLALAGAAIGAIGAAGALELFRAVVPSLGTTSPWTLAGSAGVLFTIAVIASWLPAARVLRIDPAAAVRE